MAIIETLSWSNIQTSNNDEYASGIGLLKVPAYYETQDRNLFDFSVNQPVTEHNEKKMYSDSIESTFRIQ
jgi:hypothetical protein